MGVLAGFSEPARPPVPCLPFASDTKRRGTGPGLGIQWEIQAQEAKLATRLSAGLGNSPDTSALLGSPAARLPGFRAMYVLVLIPSIPRPGGIS